MLSGVLYELLGCLELRKLTNIVYQLGYTYNMSELLGWLGPRGTEVAFF